MQGSGPRSSTPFSTLFRRGRRAQIAGTFANLSSADDPGSPATARQVETLRGCVARMRDAGVAPGIVHLANSAGMLAHPETWFDAVRPGLALYGVTPSERRGRPGARRRR